MHGGRRLLFGRSWLSWMWFSCLSGGEPGFYLHWPARCKYIHVRSHADFLSATVLSDHDIPFSSREKLELKKVQLENTLLEPDSSLTQTHLEVKE